MKNMSKVLMCLTFVFVLSLSIVCLGGCNLSNAEMDKLKQDNAELQTLVNNLAGASKYAGMITDDNQQLDVTVANGAEVVFIVATSSLSNSVKFDCDILLSFSLEHLLNAEEPYEFSSYATGVSGYSATLGSGIYKLVVSNLANNTNATLSIKTN